MEDAKNRIDNGGDVDAIKNLLNGIIDKVQLDMSLVNNSMASLNGTLANQTNTTVLNQTTPAKNQTLSNTTVSNSKNETSILGLLADLFREDRHEKNPIENINKLNLLSRSLNSSLAASKF